METIDFRQDLLPLKDKIFRLALRVCLNREEAEDITQDILVRAWEQRQMLAGVRSIEAWVLTATHRLAIDHLRQRERQNESLDDDRDDRPDSTSDVQQQIEDDERRQRLRQCIDSLPPPQRTIIQLRDIEGHSVAETAAITGLSEDNVKVLTHRARQALKNFITKHIHHGL